MRMGVVYTCSETARTDVGTWIKHHVRKEGVALGRVDVTLLQDLFSYGNVYIWIGRNCVEISQTSNLVKSNNLKVSRRTVE